jgi:WXXGXW repeat (2 copies)
MRRLSVVSLSLLLFTLALFSVSTPASAQVAVGISVGFGPPALPVYEQPICPGDGYIWTPGYWAWDPDADDYYWVPGTWILAPEVGFLWTPPWWGWEGGRFFFHEGWWGPHVGFYGGINYGFGYFGEGFVGGRWDHDHFFYNRAVMNVNVVNIHNVYNENVHVNVNRVSFNGGPGGIEARARPEEEAAARERHVSAVAAQQEHIQQARGNRELRASVNQGRPPVAATGRPGEFSGHEAVAAREAGAPYHPPANRGGGAPHEENARPAEGGGGARPAENGGRTFTHPNELPPIEHGAAPNTGNPKQDQKYQQQQEKLYSKQNQERQKLQQQQEKEHQQMQKQNAAEAQKQQMEQRHQQQTQQLQQRHTEQAQHLQQRQAPPPSKGGHR